MPSLPPAPAPIGAQERFQRLSKLRAVMGEAGLDAVLLGSTSSLRYFTGIVWHPSERFLGAIVRAKGALDYVAPRFELDKVRQLISLDGEVRTWEEEESPFRLIRDAIGATARIGVDDQIALFMYRHLRREFSDQQLADAGPLINALRRCKSSAEIALMQHAKTVTLEVHRRAHAQLHEGQRASGVARFIDEQHRALLGASSTFCIVAFGADSALPHGGDGDPTLKRGDVVLIDTGSQIDGYNSDITRTYVFGEASADVRRVWDAEKAAQAAAFAAAKIGAPCESVDAAAREALAQAGFGPDYCLPGLPHRTGHGIGLDVHEAPNLVRGDQTRLDVGMCFSNEPMIVVPGRFGVRLEDHFHMSADGARWFTQPQASLDDPFANAPNYL